MTFGVKESRDVTFESARFEEYLYGMWTSPSRGFSVHSLFSCIDVTEDVAIKGKGSGVTMAKKKKGGKKKGGKKRKR